MSLRKLLCWLGWHDWERGRGWVPIAADVQVEYDGYKCLDCGKLRGTEYTEFRKEGA